MNNYLLEELKDRTWLRFAQAVVWAVLIGFFITLLLAITPGGIE